MQDDTNNVCVQLHITHEYIIRIYKVSCTYNKLLCNHNNDDNGSDNSKNYNKKKEL